MCRNFLGRVNPGSQQGRFKRATTCRSHSMLEPGSLTEHSVKLRSRVMRFAMHWSSVGLLPYLEFRICRELEIPRDLDWWLQLVMDFRVSMGPKQLGPLFSLRPIQ